MASNRQPSTTQAIDTLPGASTNRRRLLTLTGAAGAALAGTLAGSHAVSGAAGAGDVDVPLVGVWVVQRGSRDMVYGFAPGGILHVAGPPVVTLPPALGGVVYPAGLGAWRQIDERRYVATMTAALYDDRAQGQFREVNHFDFTLDEDGDGLTLAVAFEVSRWDGEVLERGRGQGRATRITA